MRRPNNKISVLRQAILLPLINFRLFFLVLLGASEKSHYCCNGCRRRNEWDSFEPVIEQLTDKEMEALYAREERTVR